MYVKVVFNNKIYGSNFHEISSLEGILALDGIFFMQVKVPDYEDFETIADIIEAEFAKIYPGKRYAMYTVKMPIAA